MVELVLRQLHDQRRIHSNSADSHWLTFMNHWSVPRYWSMTISIRRLRQFIFHDAHSTGKNQNKNAILFYCISGVIGFIITAHACIVSSISNDANHIWRMYHVKLVGMDFNWKMMEKNSTRNFETKKSLYLVMSVPSYI